MQLIRLVRDDDAVSEVIGVILMVAITVILAAVIAAIVLGIGGETQTTPQASFSWDWEATGGPNSNGLLTVTHESGESIKVTELFIRGDVTSGNSINSDWSTLGGDASTSIGSTSAVASGDAVDLDNANEGVASDYDLRIVWQPVEGETSATLGEDTGPDA